MAFNIDEFKAELVKTPQLATDIFGVIKDSDVVKTHTKTISDAYFAENKGSRDGEVYAYFDKAFADAGFAKPDGQKSTEWAAKIAKDSLDLKKELELLKAKDSGSNVDEKIKNIEAKYQKEKADYEALYTGKLSQYEKDLTTERTNNQVNNRLTKLSAEFGKLKFLAAIPKSVIDKFAAFELSNLAKMATEENGQFVWHDSGGNPIKNANHLNASTEEVLQNVFKEFIQNNTQGGGASGNNPQTRIDGDLLILDPSKITTKINFLDAFNKGIAAQGLTSKSDNYDKIYAATKLHYKVSELPEN